MRISDFHTIHIGKFPKQGTGRPRGLRRAWKQSNHGSSYQPYGRVLVDPAQEPATSSLVHE